MESIKCEQKNLIITFLSFYFCVQFSFGTDILVWPKEIKFNYDNTGYSNDAVTIKMDKDNYVPVPEWNKDGIKEKCAYIKGQSNRKIQVKFDSNSDNMNFLIKATVISGEGIGAVCEAFVAECDLNNEFITLDLNGSIPASVGKRTFKWKWEATALPVNSPYCPIVCVPCTTEHTYYTLLSAPQAPMDEPWTSVLDYACDWAVYQSTAAGVAQKVTECIYNMDDTDGDIDYDYASYYCTDYDKLKLSDFLNDVNSKSNVKVNCTDCGNLVNVFAAAIGCQSHSKRIWSGINTKEIDPIGSSYGWCTVSWSYHQYGWLNDLVNDASLRLDRYGNPRVPTNMTQDNYNSLLIEGSPPPNWKVYTTQIVN